MTAVTLLSLLSVTAAVTLSSALRCDEDWQCGEGGVCDTLLSCCSVRGCPRGCPSGQVCVAIGYPRCGKFSKLADTCACPRKHGCVPLGQLVPELILPQRPKTQRSQTALSHESLLPNVVSSDSIPDVITGKIIRVVTEALREELPQVLSEVMPEVMSQRTVEILIERPPHEEAPPPQSAPSPPPPEEPTAPPEEPTTEESTTPPPEAISTTTEDDREWLDIFYDLQG